MKQFISCVLSLIAFLSTASLHGQLERLLSASEIEVKQNFNDNDSRASQIQRGDVLEVFCEDFANGFDGNNGLGSWLVQDISGGDIWLEGGSGGPSGPLTGTVGPLDSPTWVNGYALFDADLWNDPGNPQMVNGSITSPTIDMSDMNSVIVDFYQEYIYCCVSESPFWLEVTINGGTEWTSFSAHGDNPLATNEFSPDGFFTSIDISCLAAGEPNVKIRLSFNKQLNPNITHYYWMIDDLCIHENPADYDVEILRVTNIRLDESWETFELPQTQVSSSDPNNGLWVGTILRNTGREDITAATLLVEYLNEDQSEVISSFEESIDLVANTNSLDCPQIPFDTVYTSTDFGQTLGTYWIRSTVILEDETDFSPDNNVAERKIDVTEYVYSQSEGPFVYELRPDYDDDEETFENNGVGLRIHTEEVGDLGGVLVNFGPNSMQGAEFDVKLSLIEEDGSISETSVVQSSFELQSEWIPGGLSESFVFLTFECTELFEGNDYFLSIVQDGDESSNELTFLTAEDGDPDNSSMYYRKDANGDYQWFGNSQESPALKAYFWCNDIWSVEENKENSEIEIFPNPAKDLVNIKSIQKISQIEIYNASGQLVQVVRDVGDKQLDLNIHGLESDVYNLTIYTDLGIAFKKIVKL